VSGNTPSKRERLIRRVIGGASASIQDLISFVGMTSREQVALEEESMSLRISISVHKSNLEQQGILVSGVKLSEMN